MEECNCAALKMRFSDSIATVHSWTRNEPPYCFKNGGSIYYNTYTSSSYACNHVTGASSRACLCRGKWLFLDTWVIMTVNSRSMNTLFNHLRKVPNFYLRPTAYIFLNTFMSPSETIDIYEILWGVHRSCVEVFLPKHRTDWKGCVTTKQKVKLTQSKSN